MVYTAVDCKKALHEAAKKLGKSPSKADYESLDIRPSSSTITRIIGGWNEAKEFAELETYSKGDNWNNPIHPKPEWVELPEGYVWDELTPQQRWYYQNRDHRMAVKDRRRNRLKRWFHEFKRRECRCDQCGEEHPATIEFHHVESKEFDVSIMVNHGYSKERIMAEIAKCKVLCANCHVRTHFDTPEIWEQGTKNTTEFANVETVDGLRQSFPDREAAPSKYEYRAMVRIWVFEYKRLHGGCTRCKEDDPICTEFHHTKQSQKEFSVGKLIDNGPSQQRLMQEIKKCELLCRNCHRLEHSDPPV